ncbi:uncharacterized protein LOC131434971 [Malaya genurostris]|uniref:uncharacterized protein LOC131434971 n=1 Tax=Malaya genurostris TaxID=325434 RepID=UPI0026F392FD|nr:uncharacterized protein LOC131434971 [Malaya genurostris]
MHFIKSSKSFDVNVRPVETSRKRKPKLDCKMKRKRCMPAMFCVICFSILIAWVMGDIFRQQTSDGVEEAGDANDTMPEGVMIQYEDGQATARNVDPNMGTENSCALTGECRILCKVIDVEVMSQKIQKVLEDLLCNDITIIIESLYIEDETLSVSWLDLDVDINIDQLELKASEIKEIEPGSFDAGCLYGTSSLTLESLKVSHLVGYAFVGLSQLKTLTLKNLPLQVVDPYILAPMMFSLTKLQVDGCLDSVNPAPFTGTLKMHNLAVVSFERNAFADVLNSDSFAMLPKLSILYLKNSQINKLRKGVIKSISSSVKQIHLEGNKLERIEDGVFDSILENDVKIYLNNNSLVCDCDLSYLQELLQLHPDMFDEIRCEKPEELAGAFLTSVLLCDIIVPDPPDINGTTPTTDFTTVTKPLHSTTDATSQTETSVKQTIIPTTDPQTTYPSNPTRPPYSSSTPPESTVPDYTFSTTDHPPTPPSPPPPLPSTTTTSLPTTDGNLYALQCLSTAVTSEASVTVVQASEINIHRRSKTFMVSDAQEGAVQVQLDQFYYDSFILWFYDTASSSMFPLNIEDGANCAEISGRSIRITNLIPDKNYIFCIILLAEKDVSPFDCLPHKLLPSYGQRTWLTEDQQIIVISILISSILISVLTGIMATYCFVNSFTTYKKACRNMSTDRRLDKSATNQCYMTPAAPEQSERPRHKRSVSDTSVESCRSYVSAVVPATQFQYISWKMENRSRPSMEYYPKDPPPPPLPPHPSKRLKKQKSEIKINFQEIYDEPTSTSYTSCPPMKMPSGKH